MSSKQQSVSKVLLSIKPEFAKMIFNGNKNYEYRKTIFSKTDIDTIVVYASAPTSQIIGEFKVVGIYESSPDDLWQLTSNFSGISEKRYRSYFYGRTRAYAIEIGERFLYEEPKCIKKEYGRQPPQSFIYI